MKRFHTHTRNTSLNAFTLIELLVVIVIIGILAGIGISSFRSYQGKAENAQRISTVKQYVDALKRMNASNESFPITTNLSTGIYPSIACIAEGFDGNCEGNTIFPIASVQTQFKKHISGDFKMHEATLSDRKRDGLIYLYPIYHPQDIQTAQDFNLNPSKTAILSWVMDEANYPCQNISKTATFSHNYAGQNTTYCNLYIEDKN